MKILLIFTFFCYIWFIDSKNLCSILILKNNDKVLIFNIAHFGNFEISAFLQLTPPSSKRLTSQLQNLGNTVKLNLAILQVWLAWPRNGLTNFSCANTANQWLSNHKDVQPTKIKDMNLGHAREEKKRPFLSTPK